MLPLATAAEPPGPIDRPARRVFFAHQSVGENLLEGLAELPGPRADLALSDAKVGVNGDPIGKIADFERQLEARAGKVDVALFKLCYVDFDATTDVDALFARYREAHDRLVAKHPTVTFVHVTAPLTTVQGGLKGLVKRGLGKAPHGALENVKREQFNARLRARYASEPLFDLALVESTGPDGKRTTFDQGGATVAALAPAWTDDGGHLNAKGRRVAAEALLAVLRALPAKAPPPPAR